MPLNKAYYMKIMGIHKFTDWVGSTLDRRPILGYCVLFRGNLIFLKSKKRYVVVRSSTKVEYRAMTRSKNGIFKSKVFSTWFADKEPLTIEEDFQIPLSPDRSVVRCKWIFKVKKNADGSIARYKGEFVVQGYSQQTCIDFQETFSPVFKPTTIRVVIVLAVTFGWPLRQVDINNGFLNGDLIEDIYMLHPLGFEKHFDGQQLVCKLRKALYGLKQARRAWFCKLKEYLVAAKFVVSKSDASLCVQQFGTSLIYVLVYVNDIIITGNNTRLVDEFVCFLNS
ncbi:Retrovirus-related Pol polyprotein from transposon TNT 1-94 [Gossypium australe]|uniref:Retrovirus-related Pol polyprotein from transposon TNT 1-94 n=1 Tax=Gossypium australe TaxID=47621 RepID=A0A5B6WZP7_9ROSI|nr:Retrovirus-related Pol polyprotein from transposon TNT 1-94 [Gossypium australe]